MILVTGAAGKVGRPVVHALARAGRPVRALVRTPPPEPFPPGVDVATGDLADPSAIDRAVRGTTGVLHLAARVVEGPLTDAALMRTLRAENVEAAGRLARAAAAAGATRFLHVSSAAVWGYRSGADLCEDTPAEPQTAYGLSKLEGERAVAAALAGTAVALTIVRPVLIAAGAGTRHDVIGEMIGLARRGLFPLPPCARGARKAMIALADVVDGVVAAYDRGAAGRLYVLTGPAFTNGEILDALARRLKRRTSWPAPLSLMKAAAWVSDALGLPSPISGRRIAKLVRDQSFSGARARAELGFEPRVSELDALLAGYFPA